jgi:hypothetical protein
MHLVEQHRVRPSDSRFAAIDAAAFASKNPYNKALYATCRALFQDRSFPSIPTLYYAIKGEPEFTGLPRKVAQWVTRGLYRASTGRGLHADVNGSYNIGRKASPDSFWQGIEAVVARPIRLAV